MWATPSSYTPNILFIRACLWPFFSPPLAQSVFSCKIQVEREKLVRNDHIPCQLFYYCVSFLFFIICMCWLSNPDVMWSVMIQRYCNVPATKKKHDESFACVNDRFFFLVSSLFFGSLIYYIAVGFGDYVYRLSPALSSLE